MKKFRLTVEGDQSSIDWIAKTIAANFPTGIDVGIDPIEDESPAEEKAVDPVPKRPRLDPGDFNGW